MLAACNSFVTVLYVHIQDDICRKEFLSYTPALETAELIIMNTRMWILGKVEHPTLSFYYFMVVIVTSNALLSRYCVCYAQRN